MYVCVCVCSSIMKQLYSEPIRVGHCISVLIDHASNSSHGLAVRCAALTALSALACLDTHPILRLVDQLQATPPDHEVDTPLDEDQSLPHGSTSPTVTNFITSMKRVGQGREWAESVLRSFLPGLCTSITKMIASDKKTATPLITRGLITWAHYVGVVMSGDATPSQSTVSINLPSLYLPCMPTSREMKGKSLLVQRDAEWERATAAKLHVLVQRLAVLVTGDTWKSHLFLVGWAHSLIVHTHR